MKRLASNVLFIGAAAMTLSVSCSASAETLKAVPATLDATKAYILVEYRLMANPYGRFPGSRKTLPLTAGLTFARYDPTLGDVRGLGKAMANPVPRGQQPIEPFRNREIVRGGTSRLFLIEVEPDTWVIQGWGGTSFSLGSYGFKAKAGSVTDLGVVIAEQDWAEGDHAATVGDVFGAALLGPFAKRPAIAPIRVRFRPRTVADMPIPASIPADRVRQVTFVSGVRFGNYLGGLVNRIDGVNYKPGADVGGDAVSSTSDRPSIP